jgi:hypothetical protein
MDRQKRLEKTARNYRREGFEVVVRPRGPDLPSFLANHDVDLIARNGRENVVVAVRNRVEMTGDQAVLRLAEAVHAEPGWRFDLVMTRTPVWPRVIPAEWQERSEHELEDLLRDVEKLLNGGRGEAALLTAWAAIEAILRVSARRERLPLRRYDPQVLVETHYVYGDLSREEYDRLRRSLQDRDALVHGFQPEGLAPGDTPYLLGIARRLLHREPAPADS